MTDKPHTRTTENPERLADVLHAEKVGCIGVCDEARAYPDRSAYMVESGNRISRAAHLHDANAILARLGGVR